MEPETQSRDVQYGGVTMLVSPEQGRYPSGNSLLVTGRDGNVLVDPSLEVHRRGGAPAEVDMVALSHAHEDHMAGLHLYPEVPALVHPADSAAVRDPDTLVTGFGMAPPEAERFREEVRDDFHVTGHALVRPIADGDVVDLGGRSLSVLHLPGHTAGHCAFLIEPDGFLFLGDVDLTSFGPYYGDRSSSLVDFESSIERLRDVEARWYGTFHHKGVVEGRREFLTQLDAFAQVIRRRDDALLQFLAESRTLDDIVAHRFVYRRHVQLPFADAVERRTAEQHLQRLQEAGLVRAEGESFRVA